MIDSTHKNSYSTSIKPDDVENIVTGSGLKTRKIQYECEKRGSESESNEAMVVVASKD